MDMKYKTKGNDTLRKLARSGAWQTVYSRSKEIGSINLFKNNRDFTMVQIVFLRWLEIYNSLFSDLNCEEK